VLEGRTTCSWQPPSLAVFGLMHVVYSSLPILNPSSSLFSNDEGWYLTNGSNGVITADLRYGLFSLLVRGYFFAIHDPFWVAVLHKSLTLVAFLLLQPMLMRKYGNRVFIPLYFTFIFLNGYIFRDCLVFLFVLLAVSNTCPGRSMRRYPAMLAVTLTRPQGLLLFLRPWLSVVLLLYFLLFMRHLYAVDQVTHHGLLSVFHGSLWKDIGALGMRTLANLNPLASVQFHITKGEYLEPTIKVLGSIPLLEVARQN
jgi:hypothetical protein